MPTVAFITPEEHASDLAALREEVRSMLGAYVAKHERWLSTEEAMREARIARSTLVQFARASAPDTYEVGRITYRKEGTKSRYLLSSCIDYARRKLGQPALRA